MTHTFEPTTPARDANALLGLTVVLILTTWSFFGRFSVVAAVGSTPSPNGPCSVTRQFGPMNWSSSM